VGHTVPEEQRSVTIYNINRCHITAIILTLLLSTYSLDGQTEAGNADVVHVKAENHGDRGWVFHVTVNHPDTGWEDYCNGWDVVTDSGIVLKHNQSDQFTRLLLHPHENEQPFTRSQSRLKIPASAQYVTVRAHDLVHGFGGKEIQVNLESGDGEDYEITHYQGTSD